MQSIADLSMGERFKELARQITLDVHKVLAGEALIMSHIPRMFWHKAFYDTLQQDRCNAFLQSSSETLQFCKVRAFREQKCMTPSPMCCVPSTQSLPFSCCYITHDMHV